MNHSSFTVFMRTMYATLVFALLFYGILAIERIVNRIGFTDPYHIPTPPYVAVLNQHQTESPLPADFMIRAVEEITNIWRFGN